MSPHGWRRARPSVTSPIWASGTGAGKSSSISSAMPAWRRPSVPGRRGRETAPPSPCRCHGRSFAAPFNPRLLIWAPLMPSFDQKIRGKTSRIQRSRWKTHGRNSRSFNSYCYAHEGETPSAVRPRGEESIAPQTRRGWIPACAGMTGRVLMTRAFAVRFRRCGGVFCLAVFAALRRRAKTFLQGGHQVDDIAGFSGRSHRNRSFALFLPLNEFA